MQPSELRTSPEYICPDTTVRPIRSLLLALPLSLAVLAACDDGTGPTPELTGTWILAEYVDAGVIGITTGTMIFDAGGTFTTEGTVTYPGEPEDSLTQTGTWSQRGSAVSLTAEGETSQWRVGGTNLRVTLVLVGQTPVTRIVLARHSR